MQERILDNLLPSLVLDEDLAKLQFEFLDDDKLRIATFYPKRYKSHILCSMLGHDYFSIDGFDENGEVSEVLICCLRCKVETLRKVSPVKTISELIN